MHYRCKTHGWWFSFPEDIEKKVWIFEIFISPTDVKKTKKLYKFSLGSFKDTDF